MIFRQAFRGMGFAGLTLYSGTGVYRAVQHAKGDAARLLARDEWTDSWGRGLLHLFGIEAVVHGDPGPKSEARVVVSNHRSIIDIALILPLFGGAFLSRADIDAWPIIGHGARSAGTIFVDRSDKKSGARAIAAMVERLETHDTVNVFPEGTTFVDDEIRPFKPGAFVAAIRAGVPVVPVALAYPKDSGAAFGGESFLRHLARLADAPATQVVVEIGEALRAHEGEDASAFSERCRAAVARLLAQGRSRLGGS